LVWKDSRTAPFFIAHFEDEKAARLFLDITREKLGVNVVDKTSGDLVTPGETDDNGHTSDVPDPPVKTRLRVRTPKGAHIHVILRVAHLPWYLWAVFVAFIGILSALHWAVDFGAIFVLGPFAGAIVVGYYVYYLIGGMHVIVRSRYIEIYKRLLVISWKYSRIETRSIERVFLENETSISWIVIVGATGSTKVGTFCPPQDNEWLYVLLRRVAAASRR
jgi:hypothetical protein